MARAQKKAPTISERLNKLEQAIKRQDQRIKELERELKRLDIEEITEVDSVLNQPAR